MQCPFFETSAKSRINVEEAYFEAARVALRCSKNSGKTTKGEDTNQKGTADKKKCVIQ